MTTVEDETPLFLKTQLPEPSAMEHAQLERYVTDAAGNHVRRRARVLLVSNQTDPELACKVMEEFNNIATATRLNLNTGELKFEFFRQCLGGAARLHWDVAVAAQAGQTNAEFNAAIALWFGKHFEQTALHDQKQCFLQAKKAHAMSVRDTAIRVEEIIRWMCFMPGAPAAGTPTHSNVEKKMVLCCLMLPIWKT